MVDLNEFLTDQGYHKIKLKKIATNHFEIKATINKVKGNFIVDTGASNSCLGFEAIDSHFLVAENSEHKASGAGATDIETRVAKKNKLKIGKFKLEQVDLVLIDLTHINTALTSQKAEPVTGIIGADILFKGQAIIDYGKKYLYLKN